MKFSLLEGVQEILSSLDSDEVNSISDTVESMQVATILKSVYYDIFNDLNLIEHETPFGFEGTDEPVVLTVPSNVTRVSWIKYDNREAGDTTADYTDVCFQAFHEFIEMQQSLRDEDDIASATITGDNEDTFTFIYRTNVHPQRYTFYDNQTVLFDALDTSIDSSLTQSKFLCMGHVFPEFELVDNFVPDLDPPQFRYYLHRAKVRAFAELKQAANQEATSEARRQKIVTQSRKNRIATRPAVFDVPRYGRK